MNEQLIIPEVILFNALEAWLKYIRTDYKKNALTPTKSYLGMIFGNNQFQRYNFLEQARSVFITNDNTSPRNLEINLFFNPKRNGLPTIHITNSSDQAVHDSLSIGIGIEDAVFDDVAQTYVRMFNRRFQCKYNLVITSDNTNEVLLIYTALRSGAISLIEHLALSGIENVKISGQDIQMKSDIVPANVFIKSVGISFEMNVLAPQLKHEVFFPNPTFEFRGEIDISEF